MRRDISRQWCWCCLDVPTCPPSKMSFRFISIPKQLPASFVRTRFLGIYGAGKVFGPGDRRAADKWDALIRKRLNKTPAQIGIFTSCSAPPSTLPSLYSDWITNNDAALPNLGLEVERALQKLDHLKNPSEMVEINASKCRGRQRYKRMASKQMAGIFITIWMASKKKISRGTGNGVLISRSRIIWFGDLNYRLSFADSKVQSLIHKKDWKTLQQSDQQNAGRISQGWCEGYIDFAPTYKYAANSDEYCGYHDKPGGNHRVQAWYDRILWYGKGLKQVFYVRGENRFSDHRPVFALFSTQIEALSNQKLARPLAYP
eukprot:Gb_30198 [translate_table: standard]